VEDFVQNRLGHILLGLLVEAHFEHLAWVQYLNLKEVRAIVSKEISLLLE
jgi:hypothetical protein